MLDTSKQGNKVDADFGKGGAMTKAFRDKGYLDFYPSREKTVVATKEMF
jgi:hypothetical protein